ncbi:MAG: Rhodanese domain protein [Thermoleophilia bacterium]|nr:Rhodanese domain protein [Thermoleophilia bacterium]
MPNETQTLDVPEGPFVSGTWLEQHLDDPRVRILDTRGRVPAPGDAPISLRSAFDDGHVPGASFVTWNVDFIAVDDPVANQLADPERFAAAASRLGIDDDTIVVTYDDYHSVFAARLWWAFRAMGHDRVRVLDGGWTAWLADGRPTSTADATPEPATFTARPRAELRWTLDQVAQRDDEVVLLDARSRARFAGTGNDPVGGHIPGAVNVPYTELVGDDGLVRAREELTKVLRRAGIDPEDPPARIVASCGSGISASVPLLALELLAPGAGARAAVYDGSWSEWSKSGNAVETGPG